MSVYLQEELWVTVHESERPNAPCPRPLSSGFSNGRDYRILGLHCPSETSEAYFILCNDRNEVWFVSNQHFRLAEGNRFRRENELCHEFRPFEGERVEAGKGRNGHPKYDVL